MSNTIDLDNMTAGDRYFLEHRNASFFVGDRQRRNPSRYDVRQAEARRKSEELREKLALNKEFEL